MWYLLVLILRCQEQIRKSDFNWLYLAMALLKALFGFRRITLSRVKTYDLALIGWVTAVVVRTRTVSSLVAMVMKEARSLIQSPGVAMVMKEARS